MPSSISAAIWFLRVATVRASGSFVAPSQATPELCRWSRACLALCGAGCAEDCVHVRHAALCVGKRQGCGEEAVTLVAGSRRRCNMQHDRKWPERRPRSRDRKSTRLNSSHLVISYAVFCLKKKKKYEQQLTVLTTS